MRAPRVQRPGRTRVCSRSSKSMGAARRPPASAWPWVVLAARKGRARQHCTSCRSRRCCGRSSRCSCARRQHTPCHRSCPRTTAGSTGPAHSETRSPAETHLLGFSSSRQSRACLGKQQFLLQKEKKEIGSLKNSAGLHSAPAALHHQTPGTDPLPRPGVENTRWR
jgi:hypothetical protein